MKTKRNYVVQVMMLLLGVLTLAVVSSCGEKQENGHGYVDLGLPSGTMWATCNVGADTPKDYGNLYQFEERQDAVKKWGGKWRIPTKEEIKELLEICELEKMVKGNVIGCKITGPNGNNIFIPFAGEIEVINLKSEKEKENLGISAHIWSDDRNIQYATAWYSRYDHDTFEYQIGYAGHLKLKDGNAIEKNVDYYGRWAELEQYLSTYKYSVRPVFSNKEK